MEWGLANPGLVQVCKWVAVSIILKSSDDFAWWAVIQRQQALELA